MLDLPRSYPRRCTNQVRYATHMLGRETMVSALRPDPADVTARRTLTALLLALFRHYRLDAPVGMREDTGSAVAYRLHDGAEREPLSRLTTALWPDMASVGQPAPIMVSDRPGDADMASLVVHLAPAGDHVRLVGAYDPGVFDSGTMSDLLRHLGIVLQALAACPSKQFAEVDILTPRELALLLHEWNGQSWDGTEVTTLDGLFRTQAALTPEAPALVDATEVLTYRQLDAVSDAAAIRLRDRVSDIASPVIAVDGPRTWKTFALALSAVKAGAAFMYLDPAAPVSWRRHACQIAQPVVIIGERRADDDYGPWATAPLDDLLRAQQSCGPVGRWSTPEAAAYVALTSGSTGLPKGVVRSHRLQTSRLSLEQRIYGFDGSDAFLLKSPPAAREFFWPVSIGARAVIARQGGEIDADYLIDLIEERGITVATLVPSIVKVLVNARRSLAGTPLRHVFCGGEILPVELEEKVRALGIEIHNTYTLNEADMICHRKGSGPAPRHGSVIGKPLDMRVYLCDDQRHLVPPGAVGEIYTGGPGLASGYLGSDTPTGRFVANTFDASPARVLFRTGDLARFLDRQGNLEFIGRLDSQLKIRGQRVEPAAVEHAIEQSDLVEMVAVGTISDPSQEELLVAYIVPASDKFEVSDLRGELAESVPSYLIPTYFVPMDQLPLLPNGKVNRAALTFPARVRPATGAPCQQPRDEEERALAPIWRQVLGLDAISVNDDFFVLGGDSLRLMIILAVLASELHWRIDPSVIFEHPTIALLAERMRRDLASPAPSAVVLG